MKYTTLIEVESLAEQPLVLLDCRFDLADPLAGRRAYLAGHIPGALYVDLNQDLAAPTTAQSGRHPLPSPEVLDRLFASLGVADGIQVVAYDAANGSFAARAWWLLRWLGIDSVAVLNGGFQAWVASGSAVEAGDPIETVGSVEPYGHEPAQRAPQPRLGTVADADEVLGALRDPRRLLVDARAPERFSGTVEPLDPVAGHVPGAVNHPFSSNLGADGRFLAAAELRRRWLDRLDGRAPDALILMCGSGVTACHNALALERAGLPGAKLYAGSWSEWIRDPQRPVARDVPS